MVIHIFKKIEMGLVMFVCNPSTLEAEAGGSQVPASLGYIVRHCLNKPTNQPTNQPTKKQSK
jgi:hypothetical protein